MSKATTINGGEIIKKEIGFQLEYFVFNSNGWEHNVPYHNEEIIHYIKDLIQKNYEVIATGRVIKSGNLAILNKFLKTAPLVDIYKDESVLVIETNSSIYKINL